MDMELTIIVNKIDRREFIGNAASTAVGACALGMAGGRVFDGRSGFDVGNAG